MFQGRYFSNNSQIILYLVIFTGKSRETGSWRSDWICYCFLISATSSPHNPTVLQVWRQRLEALKGKIKRDFWGKHPKLPFIENIYYSNMFFLNYFFLFLIHSWKYLRMERFMFWDSKHETALRQIIFSNSKGLLFCNRFSFRAFFFFYLCMLSCQSCCAFYSENKSMQDEAAVLVPL